MCLRNIKLVRNTSAGIASMWHMGMARYNEPVFEEYNRHGRLYRVSQEVDQKQSM